MKQIMLTGLCLVVFCISGNAETLYLKNSREMHCDNLWIDNNSYICESFGGIVSFDKKQIDLKKMQEIAIVRAKNKKEAIVSSSTLPIFKNEIKKSLKAWYVSDVTIKNSTIIIKTTYKRLTQLTYTSMIGTGLSEMVYSTTEDDWPDIKEIKIINNSQMQGYSFLRGRKGLVELTKIPMNNIEEYIMNKTLKIGSKSQSAVRLMPFYQAIAQEFWIIKDSNIALMHKPVIPSSEQAFQKQVIVLLDSDTKIEVIKAKNSSWKEVFMINEQDQRILRGWILSSTVKSAYKL